MQRITGAVLSTTVTVAVQVDVFPAASTTVSVTGKVPAALNVLGDTVMLAMVQLSVLPAFIMDAVMEACPVAFSTTVAFWQIATGAVLSVTITSKEQVLVLPAASVAV